ncbi:uncharacterized protein PGTG_02043 [Puccinia graminis f. sp. tritici CRL 75-36-700-3]|uniref:RRM Nup35-type domain-containing protein n=1 Tax=Puccinia graminis f. sp. tritici (strain CRL 75-36-700-3 / race SCCL) TaxID=418459 RepID=E3JX07_PUCGT|nr:uncharacterized protein PGTG_02043 [Puccinia graminis f. sp. tritici CRL 75-36-700-3]EFP76582.1 hypothetical protein PGTG_02043 [Puccinia graminis f. sp. tritici CRL 75-36-700-3]
MPFPQSTNFGGSGSGSPLNLNPSVGSDGPRQYAAGYISTTSTGHHHMDHSQSMNAISQKNNLNDQDDWVSSPINSNRIRTGTGPGSASKSPYRGSGGGLFAFKDSTPLKSSRNSGLFGSTSKMPNSIKSKRISDAMEDDAPPKESLLDEEASNSKSSRHDHSGHRSLASSLTTHLSNQANNQSSHVDQAPQTSSSVGYKVHIFGFTPSQQSFVMEHFSSIGELVCPPELSAEGGNWATLSYKHNTAAQRAVRKNGEILGGIIMIGCKFADNSCSLNDTYDSRAGSEQRKLGNSATGLSRASSMIVSRSLKTYASTEAFATPTQSSDKGLLGMISNAGKPNPSIFQNQTEDPAKDQANSSYINRALDLVFGW